MFSPSERIVRFIYSDHNLNSKTTPKTLKSNFVAFSQNTESGKYELSCFRFELDSMKGCTTIGRSYENPEENRSYFGIACIDVAAILNWETHSLAFTPKSDNPNHVDIYDEIPMIEGRADNAAINYKREMFRRVWKIYDDAGDFDKSDVQPIKGYKELLEHLKAANVIK
jgi:hypothetical protein